MNKRYYRLGMPLDIDRQLSEAQKSGNFAAFNIKYFIGHLVMLGLREYQTDIQCEKAYKEARLKAAGRETLTNEPSHGEAKIIPFPKGGKE